LFYKIKILLLVRVFRFEKVHFLHIGKTGGTAIKYAIKNNLITKKYIIFLHPHKIRLCDIPKGEKVVFFLRNPTARFISAFYSRKSGGKPRYDVPWSIKESEAFNIFFTPNDLAKNIFSNDLIKRKFAQNAMKNIGHLKASFFYWFNNKKYFKSRINDILFIGFQESLNEDFEVFKNVLKISENVKLPTDKILAHKNLDGLDIHLDKIAKINLLKWYSEDIDFFNYCLRLKLNCNRTATLRANK